MIKYYCDRCKVELPMTAAGKQKAKEHFRVDVGEYTNGRGTDWKFSYLCKKCVALVKSVMENKDIGPFKPKL